MARYLCYSHAEKGDLQSLCNWQPTSLINTDAKIFSWLLKARLIQAADSLINPFQTGFLADRCIADNGMLAKLAMEQAHGHRSSSSIALLLDQEKAYDRCVLCAVSIPDTSTSATTHDFLFFTSIRINLTCSSVSLTLQYPIILNTCFCYHVFSQPQS